MVTKDCNNTSQQWSKVVNLAFQKIHAVKRFFLSLLACNFSSAFSETFYAMDKPTVFGACFTLPWLWTVVQLVVVGEPFYATYLLLLCAVLDFLKTSPGDSDVGELESGDSLSPVVDPVAKPGGPVVPKAVLLDHFRSRVRMGVSAGPVPPRMDVVGQLKLGDVRRPFTVPPRGVPDADSPLPDPAFFALNRYFFIRHRHHWRDIRRKMDFHPGLFFVEEEAVVEPGLSEDNPVDMDTVSSATAKKTGLKGHFRRFKKLFCCCC